MGDLISITEYAKRQGVTREAIKKRCQRDDFKTARKIGLNWVIDEDEPYIDKRITTGKYKNWRNKTTT